MRAITTAVAALTAIGYGVSALPASAQTDYQPPKMVQRAAPTKPIAGNGQVVVQVIVDTNGSAKFNKIIKSTNPGDNDAAIQIATDSKYAPAVRGGKASKDFYDFTIKFNGKSVAPEANSPTGNIEALIRQGKYADAKNAANASLLANPGNPRTLELLGASNYFLNDFQSAASAFSRVDKIDKEFSGLAAQSLANAAAAEATKNPQQALDFATRAVALDNSTNSKFALGVAQMANGQNAQAIASFKAVRESVMNDPKSNTQTKVNVDSRLMQAYLATNDSANADAMQAEIAKLDPSNTSGAGIVMANHYIQLASDAQKNKQYDVAISNYEQAAKAGGDKVAVTAYTNAAFVVYSMDKPDWKRGKAYADKALAVSPGDPGALFAEGVGMTGLWGTGSKSDADKTAALAELNKADAAAKAGGNEALALQIESFIKNNIKP